MRPPAPRLIRLSISPTEVRRRGAGGRRGGLHRLFRRGRLHTHTRESRDRLTLPGRTARLDLNWSPDGHFFAYVDAYNPNSDVGRLWLLKLEDGRRPFHEVGLSAPDLPRGLHIHWLVHAISRPACSASIR